MEGKINKNYTIAIVCSSLNSYASDFIKKYANNGEYGIVCIYNKKVKPRSKLKIFKKILRIGIFGAIIGLSLRKYYRGKYDNIRQVCIDKDIPFFEIEDFNISQMYKELLKKIDIGISLGNGYIPKSFYTIFKEGMLNIHHELLPEYPGASSIIWSLYDGKRTTGFTIHIINSKIDGGDILFKQEMPILFKNSLGETIKSTYEELKKESLDKLHLLIPNLKKKSTITLANTATRSYTTPSLSQFLVIIKNFKKLKLP